MTNIGEIPDFVLERAQKRRAVSIRQRMRTCAIDGCDLPATHSPCNGHDSCETHRTRPPVPVPDPTRTEAYLRATRGATGTPNRTSFDNRVEQLGQRVPAAKRADLRNDTHGIAS